MREDLGPVTEQVDAGGGEQGAGRRRRRRTQEALYRAAHRVWGSDWRQARKCERGTRGRQ
jgi:hypothetical protein